MSHSRLLYVLLMFAGLLVLSVQQWGCSKEYSYEGGDTTAITDTTIITDTTSRNDSTPPMEGIIYCPLCNEEDHLKLGDWNFKNNQSYFCGTTTSAGMITNTDFTFFGPSACSTDSGIVITAYMPVPLDKDKTNITSHDIAFYYYDHKGSKDMFIKLNPLPFSLTVSSYVKSTGIATGTFGGTVYKPDGSTTQITNGRFMIKLN